MTNDITNLDSYHQNYGTFPRQSHRTNRSIPGGYLVDAVIFLLFISLLFKQSTFSAGSLTFLSAYQLFYLPLKVKYHFPLFVTSIFYVAMSTVTALAVSYEEGLYRVAQFIIIVGGTLAISEHLARKTPVELKRFMLNFTIITMIVLVVTIFYFLFEKRYSSWKNLYDTKIIFSILIVVVFFYEDQIRRRYGIISWAVIIVLVFIIVVLSGERKAYLLMAIVFLCSRSSFLLKLALASAFITGISIFLSNNQLDAYVSHQIGSLLTENAPRSFGEFFMIPNIGDYSDIIRDFTNRNAWSIFLDNPLFGLGATGYQNWAIESFGSPEENGGLSINVHGEINRVPAEGGIIGISIAILYFAFLCEKIWSYFLFHGGFKSSSAQRLPMYLLFFLSIYMWFEALDTIMLAFILLFGIQMAVVRKNLFITPTFINH